MRFGECPFCADDALSNRRFGNQESARDFLRGEATEQTFAAVNRRGREFHCHVQVMPLTDSKGGVYGVILLMSEVAE